MVRLRADRAGNGVPLLVTLTSKNGGAPRPKGPPRCPAQVLVELAAAAEVRLKTLSVSSELSQKYAEGWIKKAYATNLTDLE